MIRLLIVNDHRLVREALRDSLTGESGIEVVGEAGDVRTALECTQRLLPDVVLVRIGSPGTTGIDAISALKTAGSANTRIIALTIQFDPHLLAGALRAGAFAYVTKSLGRAELVHAIRTVAAGQTYLGPEAAEWLASQVHRPHSAIESLSPREREVLTLIAQGERTRAIAHRLSISGGTVEVHRRNIARKLGLRTVAEVTRYAIREGIVIG